MLRRIDVNIIRVVDQQNEDNQENLPPNAGAAAADENVNTSLSEQFFRACTTNNRAKLNEILRRRQDRKVTPRGSDNYQSPLHFAVNTQNYQNVLSVLAHGRHIVLSQRELTNGYTALALACSIPTMPIPIIEDILDAKPSVASIPDNRMRTPFDILCEHGRYDLFRSFAERVKMPLSQLSNRPQIALELIQNARSFEYIFSYDCHRSWRTGVFSQLFGYDLPVFKSAMLPLATALSGTNQYIWFIPWEAAIKECMERHPQNTPTLAKKIFLLMYALRGSREFMHRQYYFSSFLRTWQPLSAEQKRIMIDSFLPFMQISYAVGNDPTYRAMIHYMPFDKLRRADVKVLSLTRLAKDTIRKEIERRYNIAYNIKLIYQQLRKHLPKKVASFVLHVSDSNWFSDWEVADKCC